MINDYSLTRTNAKSSKLPQPRGDGYLYVAGIRVEGEVEDVVPGISSEMQRHHGEV